MANRFQEVQKSDATGLFFAPQKFSPLKLFSTFIIFFGNREEVLAIS
jgi:hypothetical protein